MKNKVRNEEVDKLLKWAPVLLSSIKPIPDARYEYTQTFKVSGYVHLICIVEDLIKLCAIATSMDPPRLSTLIHNDSIDVSGILEIVLQILPSNEMELLENMVEFVKKDQDKGKSKKSKKKKHLK